jgi:hypothetical protein
VQWAAVRQPARACGSGRSPPILGESTDPPAVVRFAPDGSPRAASARVPWRRPPAGERLPHRLAAFIPRLLHDLPRDVVGGQLFRQLGEEQPAPRRLEVELGPQQRRLRGQPPRSRAARGAR